MKSAPTSTVLVLASTFPASDDDPVPAFVKDQVIAMSVRYPELGFHVLAPHDPRSKTQPCVVHEHYVEHRFHYFWPRSAEKLAGRGIMPALKENPLLFAVIPFLFLGEFVAARKLVRDLAPAILYAHWFTPQAVVASLVSRGKGVPFVFTTHASDVDVWHRVPVLGKKIVRAVTKRAVAISAVSSRSRDKLRRFLALDTDASRVHVIPMGVPLQSEPLSAAKRAKLRTSLGIRASTVYVFIGRLVEKKGLRYLLDAFAIAGDELGDWTLLIAGDGPLREELRNRVTELGLGSRVTFLGFVAGERKHDYLRAANVMLVPSIVTSDGDAEGLPVSLLEGLSYGLCCIATAESGADDVITDGIDGMLCAQQDSDELAKKLCELHNLSSSKKLTMSRRAETLSRTFEWGNIAERHYTALFAPVLQGKP